MEFSDIFQIASTFFDDMDGDNTTTGTAGGDHFSVDDFNSPNGWRSIAGGGIHGGVGGLMVTSPRRPDSVASNHSTMDAPAIQPIGHLHPTSTTPFQSSHPYDSAYMSSSHGRNSSASPSHHQPHHQHHRSAVAAAAAAAASNYSTSMQDHHHPISMQDDHHLSHLPHSSSAQSLLSSPPAVSLQASNDHIPPQHQSSQQQQQQQQQLRPRTLISPSSSSPFLLNYLTASPDIDANATAKSLTSEQQQRLYADFIAGKNINSFNALPPGFSPKSSTFGISSRNPSSTSLAFSPNTSSANLQFQPSNPEHTGMSSDISEDSDADDSPPLRGKRPGRSLVKTEATPTSTVINAPYYKGGGSSKDEYESGIGGDPNDRDRLGKRLARKAELARASRRRKKMYVQDLENKVKSMAHKIEELQAKVSSTRSKAPTHLLLDEDQRRKSAQQNIRRTMSALLSRPQGVDGPAEKQQMHQLVKQFVENSRERQNQVETYLDRVEESLTPGLQAKFAMWGLDQHDEFYTKPGLWTSLMSKEIGLTSSQMNSILSQRSTIHQERENLSRCERMIKELRQAGVAHLKGIHKCMDEIQSVMTPIQLAKFYLWVENNEWTMQMLNSTLGFNSSNKSNS